MELTRKLLVARLWAVALVMMGSNATAQQCIDGKRGLQSKNVYRVGIYANRGVERAYSELHPTFGEFLTKTAGARFDPPVQFEATPVAVSGAFETFMSGEIDFLFANPSIFSCMESEIGANSLVTLINQRRVEGETYDLTQFGGVIFTRADNAEVNTITDIQGKRVGCLSIASLGSGLLQFQLLKQAGIHYMQDVKQLMFMKTQGNVVNGVISGKIDVGFVRTDQLERTIDDRTGELLDLSEIKIIGAQEGLENDGAPFPFSCSTPLYPEWNIASFNHVSDDVAREVQSSLLSLADHAAVGAQMLPCFEINNCAALDDAESSSQCLENCFTSLDKSSFERCDTTADLALTAVNAVTKAKHAGWRSTLSYLKLRDTQEDAGFISFNEAVGKKTCARLAGIEDAVTCPPGHFKKKDEDILAGCERSGLPCHDFQCLCSPCAKAFEVDFLPLEEKLAAEAGGSTHVGCDKSEVCGKAQQMSALALVAVDNMKRPNTTFTVKVSSGEESEAYEMTRLGGNFEYQWTFDASGHPVGVMILEVYANGQQIPQSPFRMQVVSPDCVADTGDDLRVPDASGQCVCGSNTSEIGSKCVRMSALLSMILVPLAVLVTIGTYLYVERKRKQADSVWVVQPEELKFEDPPQVLGRGSFGLVLLADYRGTQVAVKRVLPQVPKKYRAKGSRDAVPGTAESTVSGSMSSMTWKLSDTAAKNTTDGRKSHFDFYDNGNAGDDEEQQEQAPSNYHDPEMGAAKQNGMASSKGMMGSKGMSSVMGMTSTATGIASRSRSWLFGKKSGKTSQLRQDFIKEMRLVSKLRHPCITTVMGAVIANRIEPMLVMEKMELGSLYDLLHNESLVLGGEILLPILRDLSQGIRFLHGAMPQIVHGDLKAQNVLVDDKFRAKVADFGLSQKGFLSSSASGTPLWMAPELLRGEVSNTPASDVYAFGILLYEVFSRKNPYEGEDHSEVLQLVADKNVNKRPPVPAACPPTAAELMKACLRADPDTRPSSEDIVVSLSMLEAESIEPGASMHSLQSKKSAVTQRTEALLSQMFPKHIAEALRDGHKIEPEKHECVTVYFSDIVGYTRISSSLDPSKVSDLLDRLYTKFDDLCGDHTVFKIETVGDAYMASTNLELSQPDHAVIMARFALSAIEAASTTLIDEEDPSKGYVQIRAGFHSGPVVTHVVGSRNPRFSVIGDTVNTASRMESNSLPGRIQCSEAAARCLEKHMEGSGIKVRCRGEIEIKGKGEMTCFWIKQSSLQRANSMNSLDSMDSKDSTDVSLDAHLSPVASPTSLKANPLLSVDEDDDDDEEEEEESCSNNDGTAIPLGAADNRNADMSSDTPHATPEEMARYFL